MESSSASVAGTSVFSCRARLRLPRLLVYTILGLREALSGVLNYKQWLPNNAQLHKNMIQVSKSLSQCDSGKLYGHDANCKRTRPIHPNQGKTNALVHKFSNIIQWPFGSYSGHMQTWIFSDSYSNPVSEIIKLIALSIMLLLYPANPLFTETYHEKKASFDLSCPLCSNSKSHAAYRHSGCCRSAVFISSYVASRKEKIIKVKLLVLSLVKLIL